MKEEESFSLIKDGCWNLENIDNKGGFNSATHD